MEPSDPQRTTMPGQVTGEPETVVVRRMDPRLWALLPLIALCILGAYMLGKRMNSKDDTAPPTVAATQPTMATQPSKPPSGKISVTEVPHPIAPVTTPAPAMMTPPTPVPAKPKPAKPPAYQHVEPPVVLPPPSSDDSAPPIMPAEPPGDTGSNDGGTVNPGDAPKPQTEADRDPVKMNDPALEYPQSAYEEGVEGSVHVSFTVTPDGNVADPEVTQSSGDNRLDQAAADYVKRLRFRPAIRNGQPSSVRANRTVRFSLR